MRISMFYMLHSKRKFLWDPLHCHRPENLSRHQPFRRRSLGESDPLAEESGIHGEEHSGISCLIGRVEVFFKPVPNEKADALLGRRL